jgi:hypothetical protein
VVFERKVIRRIFGPTKGRDGTWRIKTDDELDELIRHKNIINYINELIRHKNIINYIKPQRLSWFGHLHRMPEDRMAKKRI